MRTPASSSSGSDGGGADDAAAVTGDGATSCVYHCLISSVAVQSPRGRPPTGSRAKSKRSPSTARRRHSSRIARSSQRPGRHDPWGATPARVERLRGELSLAGTTARARPARETMLGSRRTRRGAERHKGSIAGATRFRSRQIEALSVFLLLSVSVFCAGVGLFCGEGLSKEGAGGGESLGKNHVLRRPNHRPSNTHRHCPSWVAGACAGGDGVGVGLAAGGDDDDEGHVTPLPSSGGGGAPRGADEARTKRGGGCDWSRSRSAMGDQGDAAAANGDEPFVAGIPGERAHARAPMPLATQTSAGAGTATAMAGTSSAGTGCAEWQGAAAHGSNPQPTEAATSSTTSITRATPTRRRSDDAPERNI